ncbi:hypothetical protein J7F03_20815 [Streptomyces sp. ISL-43]|uniref:hypothetical protein n=1 Tax=Streptomyces sp. ISL-43 TaxID=2819183 RepID=UPI001BEBAA2F|nr:hypothetical protein [Streptomyces sp. ISL-43]MBT2449486.1 hypothetical protein [Streptomyces sp. ISL-43]
MTHWKAGQTITAAKLAVENTQAEDTTSRTSTNTLYVDASGGVFSAAVVVPASGQVKVTLRSTQRNSGATNTLTSWTAVGSTSGTVYSANDAAALVVGGTANFSLSLTYRLTGLTVGETVTATIKHRVGAGTGTYDYRYILLEGCS